MSRPQSSCTSAKARSIPALTPGRPDRIRADKDCIRVDVNGRVLAAEKVAHGPVGDRSAPIKQPGLGEQESPGTYRRVATRAWRRVLKPFNQTLLCQNRFDVEGARNDDCVEFLELIDRHRIDLGAFGGSNKAIIRDGATSMHHASGTARMGQDDQSVVDSRLRAHGIENLRVADASIMPTITTGNTQAPSMIIGERLAEMIKR